MDIKESKRLNNLLCYEDELYSNGYELIAGVDEVGRGCLAGPIVAAAVILKRELIFIEELNDSKKLDSKKRKSIFEKIKKSALCFSVAKLSNKKIDEISLGKANIFVLEKAVAGLKFTPEVVLSDSFKFNCKPKLIPIVKGDMLCASIAAASIIAKVTRDEIMVRFSKIYTGYGFEKNKGYGTGVHWKALKKLGPIKIHRKSFNGVYLKETNS
jgi:ribonuclease HII